MNISEKMSKLILDLPDKFNHISMERLRPTIEEQWCDDYAICCGLYFMPVFDEEYFDYDLLKSDILSYVVSYFGPNSSLIARTDDVNKLDDDHVVVHFREKCGEIEVYKAKYTRRTK